MRIRRGRILTSRSLLVLAALTGAVYILTTESTHANRAACGAAGAQNVTADRSARVYRVPVGQSVLGTLYAYYGCLADHGKPRFLAATNEIDRSHVDIKLRGVVVGVDVSTVGTDDEGDTLTVRNLATGRLVHTVITTRANGYGQNLDTYVLATSGNIAWSIHKTIGFGPANEVVIERAIGQTVTTLDHGPENRIRASSLRLRADVLSWVDGGKHRHASLP